MINLIPEIVLDYNVELLNDDAILEDWSDSRFVVKLYNAGDKVSIRMGSDTVPATVVKVSKSGKKLTIQEDKATALPWERKVVEGGFFAHVVNQEDQKWSIERDEAGSLFEHSLQSWRGIKVWAPKGCGADGRNKIVDGWRKFYDFNF
jgi:hypothetical protein